MLRSLLRSVVRFERSPIPAALMLATLFVGSDSVAGSPVARLRGLPPSSAVRRWCTALTSDQKEPQRNGGGGSNEKNALHVAAREGLLVRTQYLVEQGADMDETDGDGKTPLLLAAENFHINVVDRGCDIHHASWTEPMTLNNINCK